MIVSVILILISIYYGFRIALICLLWAIPILISKVSFGPLLVGLGYSKAQLFWILTAILIAGNLNIAIPDEKINYTKTFFVILLCLSCIFSFEYRLADNFSLHGYPFAFSIILLCGYFWGSHKGLWLGLLWGMFDIIEFHLTRSLILFSSGWFAVLTAPILGYLGGSDLFERIGFWRSSFSIFVALYGSLLLTILMKGSTEIYNYLEPIIYLLQSSLSFMLFYLLFRKYFLNRKIAREIVMQKMRLQMTRELSWGIYVILPGIIAVIFTLIVFILYQYY